ncbi:hypothetical protein MD484_g1158, partial [Candolleomyces efflorescens]
MHPFSLFPEPQQVAMNPYSQRRYPPNHSNASSTANLIPQAQPPSTIRPQFTRRSSSSKSFPSSSSSLHAQDLSSVSFTERFSLSPDPTTWGSNLSPNHAEPDDYLHNPDPKRDRKYDSGGHMFTYRGLTNLGCMITLCTGMLTLFAGYPIFSHFATNKPSNMGGFNIGGINSTGQIPSFIGNYGLIDRDTPTSALYKPSYTNPSQQLQLVFSDEFNTDGRTFYPGDDPYWEAVDLHYWATNNLEWYDPEAVITRDGFLEVSLSRKDTHGLQFQGGMISTWNKFCFTGGLLEVSVTLPGANNVMGLWPAVWSMGNLGRAGYGATLEGMVIHTPPLS